MNIYQKMAEATRRISSVAKNLQVDTGKGRGYKAVSEADVLAAVKPVENDLGIYSYPVSRTVIDSGEMVSTSTSNGNTTERRQLYLRVETVYRFVNTDEPSEYIDITTYGDGVDTQDKAPGKAMTYADKYALLKAYKIQTGDDPDKEASQELKRVESDPSKELISESERLTIEAICAKKGIDPADPKYFRTWPKVNKKGYADFMRWVNSENKGENK